MTMKGKDVTIALVMGRGGGGGGDREPTETTANIKRGHWATSSITIYSLQDTIPYILIS
jgi:hypothetical protein